MSIDLARALRPRLPDREVSTHWSGLLGTVSLAAFGVLLVTGVLLMFFYEPSTEPVRYDGSYQALQGVEMSRALSSLLYLSFEVRGGMLVRQAHHWAALILPASLVLQMLSTYFAGGFRRPRQWRWVLLCLLFLLTLGAGWSGYALPDDMLSGTGLRIFAGILISIPVIGDNLSFVVFGGEFPGSILVRLYWLHVLAFPLLLVVAWAARTRSAKRFRAAQRRGRTRVHGNLVWPHPLSAATALRVGMFLITCGVIVVMAGTLTISPVWVSGPSAPNLASSGSQPDWYTGFLDGSLRLAPSGWDIDAFGGTWPLGVLVPQAMVAVFLTIVILLPFLDSWISGKRTHVLLERPRNAPVRTALGAAGLAFYLILWVAGSTDIIATEFHIAFETQVAVLQVGLVLGPFATYYLTRGICRGLQAHEGDVARRGMESGRIRRLPNGGYVEERFPAWRAGQLAHRERTASGGDLRPGDQTEHAASHS